MIRIIKYASSWVGNYVTLLEVISFNNPKNIILHNFLCFHFESYTQIPQFSLSFSVIKCSFFLFGLFRKTNVRFRSTMFGFKKSNMNEKEKLILIKEGQLNSIIDNVRELQHEVRVLRNKRQPAKTILTNDDMRELLRVNNKLLKKYRDSGLLGYSYSGGKYWYTQDDVCRFLKNTKNGV